MNLKPYGEGMLFVTIPATLFGVFLAFTTIHSGGALFYFSFTLVPGLWFLDKVVFTESEYVWPIALLIQVLHCSAIVTFINMFRAKNEKTHNKQVKNARYTRRDFLKAELSLRFQKTPYLSR